MIMSQEKTIAVEINAFSDIEDAFEREPTKTAKNVKEKLNDVLPNKQDNPKKLDAPQL
jgi:RNA polymerase nonessential primary-like sigma factor